MTELEGSGGDLARERERLSDALVRAMSELESDQDEAHLLRGFANLLVTASGQFRLAWFYIGDPHAGVIRPTYCAGAERAYGESLAIDRSTLMMKGPVRRAFEDFRPIIQTVPATLGVVSGLLPGARRWHRAAVEAGIGSVLALPFALPGREDSGLVVLYARAEHYFDAVGLEPFRALSRLVQVGLDRIGLRLAEGRARDDIERLRRHDELTGLNNRHGLIRALDQWRQAPAADALLMQMEINDFGALAAAGGDSLGDEVLRQVAADLQALAGDEGIAARVASSEFVLHAPLAGGRSPAEAAEACQARLERARRIEERSLSLSISMAFMAVSIHERHAPDEVLRRLRVTMDHANSVGRGHRSEYAPELEPSGVIVRQDVLAGVRGALAGGDLRLHYQPQLALDGTSRMVGMEALLRWQRPGGSLVPPGRFIPAVEETLLIRDVGCWVIDEALAMASRLGGAEPVIGVNVGARHLLDPRFLDDLAAAVSRHPGFGSGRLEIEVTETAALHDPERALAVIQRLREQGFRVALDDFGTGHASLIHLRRLPVSRLKIDRAFVGGLDCHRENRAIVEGVVVMATGLGLEVLAEGVETPAEADWLVSLGCRFAQGYLFARPMPEAALRAWMRGDSGDVRIGGNGR